MTDNTINFGAAKERVKRAVAKQLNKQDTPPAAETVSIEDFYADMMSGQFIYAPTGQLWPKRSVDARLSPVSGFKASDWIAANRPVEQMTWAPGEAQIVKDKLTCEGGWMDHPGATLFNLYLPPKIVLGDATKVGPWLDHIHTIYPGDADHIVNYLAYKVQHPEDKINHAIILGGYQGIGKDTILEPVKYAVGAWNFTEVSPQQVLGKFNGFLKSVFLRISEARDLGDVDRFAFYEHMKTYTAAPPDVLRVDQKYVPEYYVTNCSGVIVTTNNKTNGIYLPPDDRRNYVAWSEKVKEDFSEEYWNGLYAYYDDGGRQNVAAYLHTLDLSMFNAKAPPKKTEAFWCIVDANRSPEDAELNDLLDLIGRPECVTLQRLSTSADPGFSEWLKDRRNSRAVSYRMEECGYVRVRNDAASDGLWKVDGRRQAIYAKSDLTIARRVAEARKL
jgi:Family of unknown function (DUF5906)